MNLSEDGRASVHPPEDREEALDALDEVVGLVLPTGRWAKVVDALGSLEAAVGSGDTEALRTATGLLESAGGTRVRTRIAEDDEPASQDVLDRIGRLVHSLRGGAPDHAPDDGPAHGDPH
ncbi:CATRA system-associated protein [Streptomyces rhizosphaericola]|uniref:CATRA system-associated protein n=1 Tax=Streptomyces rhizosphaericola TaxID=2564098 RepID=UPI0036B900B8